ncbi:protein-serine O-palmitoleoyltransferase porcupine-like [Panonychus citri]|uniref:protein-serine O-palmitoleoyltransferase porcupine-like n=1 Tax=Panonychus citri TaxID=50023 RepID=UPI002306FF10|nr:protein-serine O-palmitoleoyltransferase porcupine-like [Panonychus citri]
MDDDEFEDFGDPMTLNDCIDCIQHSLTYAFLNTFKMMLIVNLSLKIVLKMVNWMFTSTRKEIVGRYCILLAGLILIFNNFLDNLHLAFLFLLYCVIGVSLLSLRRSLTNNSLWLFIVVTISLNELTYYFGYGNGIRLRIHLMCSSMKLIALKSVLKVIVIDKEKSLPNFPFLITYLIHPQSLPIGGYFPPNLEKTIDQYSKIDSLKQTILPFIQSLIFLAFSNCFMLILMSAGEIVIVDILTTILPSALCQLIGKLFIAYCTALQFRTSHYFICHLIQFNHAFWGSNLIVAKPLMVELPRSLVDVVIAWDIPMHQWLKEYVYKPCKNRFDFASSILVTYTISSYIHGFRFEIWSVLLSLGLLTWIESLIRNLLASTFNSCIGAKSCSYTKKTKINYFTIILNHLKSFSGYSIDQPECTRNHKLTPFNSVWVIIINIAFSLLAMFHLAYLGSSFDLNEEQSSTKHVIETWFNIGFYSHIIGFATITFYYLIK